jgi:hypothetical protein
MPVAVLQSQGLLQHPLLQLRVRLSFLCASGGWEWPFKAVSNRNRHDLPIKTQDLPEYYINVQNSGYKTAAAPQPLANAVIHSGALDLTCTTQYGAKSGISEERAHKNCTYICRLKCGPLLLQLAQLGL